MTAYDFCGGRLRRSAGIAIGYLVPLVAFPHCADAATAAEYEKWIATLESRINRLEATVDHLTPKSVARTGSPAPTKDAAGKDKAAPGPVPGADAGTADSKLSGEDKSALNQLYVIRDAAVTLKPGGWEASLEFDYTRHDGFLQSSWALGAVSSLRYGAGNGLEFGIRVPYDWTHRRTETGTPSGAEVDLAALGDISFDASKLIWHEGPVMPGVVISGSVTLPTGVDPYSSSIPTPLTFYRNASGHYSVAVGAQVFKTVDPFAYFAGISFSYPFDREVNKIDVFPGYTISYNVGTTLALSETTSLGFAVLGAVHTDMFTGGVKVPGSSTMPISASISVMQRLAEGFYLEPSLTTGLTSDAPNAVLAIKATKTF